MTTRGAICRRLPTKFWKLHGTSSTRRFHVALFTSPTLVKDYLRTKLASFEHEVFAALFLDNQNRLIEYVEMFRGTIDQARCIRAKS